MGHTQLQDDRWPRFREALRTSVEPTAWRAWLGRLQPEFGADTVTLVAPSEFHLRWVLEKHGAAVEQAFLEIFGTEAELHFATGDVIGTIETDDTTLSITLDDTLDDTDDDTAGNGPESAQAAVGHPAENPSGPSARLVNKYRFDSFVVGQSNRFAWAAAMAVAEQPGNHYNPLFIYGAAGLGKTHLLNAIGHHALELFPGIIVRYVSSETFFSDFIDSIRRKRMDDFKQRYRGTDVLLLDDVQFFEGKEQILEEFFHTFNTLYESGKQMVISSDRHPRNLSSLEDRLRSRFEWGLLTDIQPPDVETRLAILKRNAEFAARPVPHDVLHFIAGLVSDNIRELEGALTRVTAFASLTDQPIELAMAERVLQDLLPGHETKAIDGPQIIHAAARMYGFTVEDVIGPSRRQPLVLCRQIAMYLCRELTDLSLPKIGALFGDRDHTTVMHAIDKVRAVMQRDRDVFDRVSLLSQGLRKSPTVLPTPHGP